MYDLCKIVSVSFYGELVKNCNEFPLRDKYSVADSCKFQQIWSQLKRKFTRFKVSTVLTVFEKHIAINA